MIIIEKLRKQAVPKRTSFPEKSIGIIDFYHSDLYDDQYPHFWHCKPQRLRERAEKYLRDNGILLAQHRGVHGVSPWEIEQFEAEMSSRYGDSAQIIYDVDVDDLITLPPRLVRMIGSRWLLFSDLTEGRVWTTKSSEVFNDQILGKMGINGNRSFMLNCNLCVRESTDLMITGTHLLPWANSFSGITSTHWTVEHIFEDLQAHLDLIDQSYSQEPKYHFLSFNGKPRMPRLQFLSRAWQRGLLDQALWSFGYFPESVERKPDQYIGIGHRKLSQDILQINDHQDFLNSYTWPKMLLADTLRLDLVFATSLDLIGKANWEVVIETTVAKTDDPSGSTGQVVMITEKFYKAILLGHPVMPIGWQGCHRDIEHAGYKLPDVDFDHLDETHWQDRLNGSLDLLEKPFDRKSFRDKALANIERLFDQDQLVRDVCEPLLHIREHPSFKAY